MAGVLLDIDRVFTRFLGGVADLDGVFNCDFGVTRYSTGLSLKLVGECRRDIDLVMTGVLSGVGGLSLLILLGVERVLEFDRR